MKISIFFFLLFFFQGVNYAEEQDYGVLMFFRGLSVPNLYFAKKGHWAMSTLNNSDEIMVYLFGKYGHEERGKFLTRSDKASEMEDKIADLMSSVRSIFYYHLLQHDNGKHKKLVCQAWGSDLPNVPLWQKWFGFVAAPFQMFLIKKVFKVC